MSENITVIKASRERVPFSQEKLHRSLKKAGAHDSLIDQVVDRVVNELYDGITTRRIYSKAFSYMRKASHSIAAKYKLKQAIMELGPSGYPFEKYVGEIFKAYGYDVQIGQTIKGHCVNHEVDVVAIKDNKQLMIECKYHSRPGIKSDVKVPLYIHSRFQDVANAWRSENRNMEYQGWVVNNTKFSGDAIQYAKCVGLQLMAWDYPENGSLQERIEISGLYPLTCLSTLSKNDKQKLISNLVVLCKEINENPTVLEKAGIDYKKHRKIIKEANSIWSE